MEVRAKKSLGQHFLTDQDIARRIVDALQGSPVLEVGPGMGVLTKYLIPQLAGQPSGEDLETCDLATGLASPDRSHPRLVRGRGPLAERVGGAERSEESGLSEPDASSLSFATGDSEQSEAVGPPELASAIKEVPGQISESLCSEPWRRAAAKPSPNSMPRTPGIENTAWEIKDSTESKNGSPRPAGTPST